MKKDERYWPVLGTWLKDTVEAPPHPQQTARRVAERLPETPQVRRHWWRPTPRRARRSPDRSGATTPQTTPIPADSGPTPTVIGRTQSMLSPAKAITASALVLALGGVMLVAQPFERESSSVPGAEVEAAEPTWVTGTTQPVDGTCSETAPASVTAGVTRRHYVCTETWSSSDPRLTGDVTRPWIEDTFFQTDEGTVAVGREAVYLRNDGGSWACSLGYLVKGTTPTSEPLTGSTWTCLGSDGYQGLSAILVSERPDLESFSEEFVGLIFSGDFPPLPEPPAD